MSRISVDGKHFWILTGRIPFQISVMDTSIRSLVKQYMDGLQWESALFWADVMMSLSSGHVEDVLAYVRCLLGLDQHLRALSFLQHRGLLKAHKVFQYFGAQCMFASQRYDEMVQLIEGPLMAGGAGDISGAFNLSCRVAPSSLSTEDVAVLSQYAIDWKVEAGLLLLLGKAYEKLENRQQAANSYKQCLLRDQSCVEAFENLTRRHMLTETDERDLFNRLFEQEAGGNRSISPLSKVAEFLYKSKAAKMSFADPAIENGTGDNAGNDDLKKKLGSNLAVMAGNAERLYYQSNYRESYAMTMKILGQEEYHSDALPIHVVNLLALSKTTELFSLAHKLIDSFPDLLIAWFAVGCYYYSIENFEAAKRFFHKCTLLDPQHGASWIGYGHSFAVEQEHDQAMNCYVKAAKVMSSCHLPLMYVGLEYSLTNNLRLAEKFFSQASTMSPDDPYVLHELGVLYFRLDNFARAEEYFRKAEKVAGTRTMWEQLLNNLGHVMRKLKRYNEALEYHRRALRLSPKNASTLAAIGYLHMFLEEFDVAVEYFHQSLSLKRDDAFVTALLNKAMDILNDTWKTPFPEPPTLSIPAVRVQGSSPKKQAAVKMISEADDAQSDVEMEDA